MNRSAINGPQSPVLMVEAPVVFRAGGPESCTCSVSRTVHL